MSYQILLMKEDGRNIIEQSEAIPKNWPLSICDEERSQTMVAKKRVYKQVLTISFNDQKYLVVSEKDGITSSKEIELAIKQSKLKPID